LIVSHISGHGKKFAVAAMGEVREDRVPGALGIIRFFEEYAIHADRPRPVPAQNLFPLARAMLYRGCQPAR
jgi:hypothetical protein